MRKPQPKYGWHGQVEPGSDQPKSPKGFKLGDRVLHIGGSCLGTIVGGPAYDRTTHMQWWVVDWWGVATRWVPEHDLRKDSGI